MIDEKAIVNGIVALLATGGSTNHTLHLVAIARGRHPDRLERFRRTVGRRAAAREDLPERQGRREPFPRGGRRGFLVRNLLEGGLLHEDVTTVAGKGLAHYTKEPKLIDGKLTWVDGAAESHDTKVLRGIRDPFQPDGGLRLMQAASAAA